MVNKTEITGVIKNYRVGPRTQKADQCIVIVEGYNKESATKLVGKKVVWKTPAGKEMIGKLTGLHGTKGALRARFEKGIPGQAIGTEVSIL